MTKVKICGIQQPADALVAASAGADFVGLVFVPKYRRRLETDAARVIVETLRSSSTPAPQIVGIFADQTLADVNHIIGACELDLAQLCGEESLKYCGEVAARVVKVVHVDGSKTEPDDVDILANRVAAYRDAGHLVTLDRLLKGVQGGSGHSFNWDIASRLSQRGFSFLLAGGLSPDNVNRAVAEVSPWGVDVSSGVETGGAKDQQKIRAFIRGARQGSPVDDQDSTPEAKPAC
jgi:phosphoribosylanthranilate isomerase